MEADTANSATTSWPSAPPHDFGTSPTSLGKLDAADLDAEVSPNFWRCARWCSDGSAILSATEDRTLRVHATSEAIPSAIDTKSHKQPDAIHSTLWYSSASALNPPTFCYMASIRDAPVRLIDANDGRIRATYPIVDHRERFIAPHSMAFNATSSKLYCGFENAIEVFDVATPGYNSSERLKIAFTRREKGGQKGIVSALAFMPDYSGTFAAGTFSGSVSLYSEDTGAAPLAFHPLNPQTIFVASRRSQQIQVFDVRDLSRPVAALERPGSSNQRLWFDVDPWGRWLASGDESGVVRVWDITKSDLSKPVLREKLHNVGSVQFHPFQPLLLTCSGSRTCLGDVIDSDDSSDSGQQSSNDEESEDDSNSTQKDRSRKTTPKKPSRLVDSTLKIWSTTSSNTDGLEATSS
nr:uncharacterized protein CI109_002780 [Kwoniella shandongensis]KAA5529022.1 hypothetical protein CI109_002780 [Kwoniella shandongensis]